MPSNLIAVALIAAGAFVLALAAPASAQQAAQTVTTIELVTWSPGSPDIKFSQTCQVSDTSVKCGGTFSIGPISGSGDFAGTAHGNTWTGSGTSRGSSSDASCRYSYDHRASVVIELRPDGTQRTVSSGGRTAYSAISGPCAPHMPASTVEAEAVTSLGTWRILGVGEAPPAVAQPGVPTTPNVAVVIDTDGKAVTINLDEFKGGPLTLKQMELAKRFEMKPPSGGAPYTLRTYRLPVAPGKDPPIYVPMQVLDAAMLVRDDFITATSHAVLPEFNAGSSMMSCAQSAANWVKANPGKASLMALGVAVSVAMPYTVAFQASAGTMTFMESAGIGFMTSATPVAVQTLVTSAMSGEGFWKSTGKATLSGTIAGVESIVSTVVGAGTTAVVEVGAALTRKLVGAQISEQAVKGFGAVTSGIAGSATDYGVGILHDKAADAIAASASRTAIPDLVPPARSTPSGGIVLPILARTAAR